MIEEILKKINIVNVRKIPNELPTYSFFYKSDNINVKGFIIFPKRIEALHPVIFMNRGGTGNVGILTDQDLKNYSFFSQKGYITVMSQYRGCDGGEGFDRMGGDDVFDIINLYNIISQIPQIDLNRVGMWGVSRGAMMAFQVSTRVNWLKALTVVSPIIDEVHMATWRPGWKKHQEETYGGSYTEQYKRSPLLWAKEIPKIPTLFFVGMKDERIDPHKAIEMAKKIDAEIVMFPEDGHFISPKTIEQSIDFFNKHL